MLTKTSWIIVFMSCKPVQTRRGVTKLAKGLFMAVLKPNALPEWYFVAQSTLEHFWSSLSEAVPSIMTYGDGSFWLPVLEFFIFFVCECGCVFIGSSASHISLERWNNLSGTVFPQGFLYLIFIFLCFICWLFVCVRLGEVSGSSRVLFFLQKVVIVLFKPGVTYDCRATQSLFKSCPCGFLTVSWANS